MHGRRCGGGHGFRDIWCREWLRWLCAEPFRPSLRMRIPRVDPRRPTSGLRTVPLNVDDFDHPGLGIANLTAAWPPLDDPLLTGDEMRALPLAGREYMICF